MKNLFNGLGAWIGGGVLLAGLYFISARYGLSLAFVESHATAVWPPTGISLAALVLFGPRRLWPAVFAGAFLANFAIDHAALISLGVAVGNTLEAVAGAWLIHRFARGKDAFERPQDATKFFFAAAAAASISASFGVASLRASGTAAWMDVWPIWKTWWLGDVVSAFVIAPLLIIWMKNPKLLVIRKYFVETVFVGLAVFLAAETVFGGLYPGAVNHYPLEFICLPPLIWAAFRFRLHGATASVLVLSAVAVEGTLRGLGPFAMAGRPNESLILLQTFIGTAAILAVILASIETVRREAENNLKQAAEDLLRSNKELEQFAYVISHDLQEPARKIINYSERLAAKSGDANQDEKDSLGRIHGAALRIRMVIEDLLQFSRLSREAVFESVDLGAILSDVQLDLELKIAESGAKITVRSPLPPIHANATQMRHVFQNLITNAIKFSKKGTVPEIFISSEALADGGARISVSDNGIGFDEKYLEKIFLPFQRLHGREEYEGNGIGLSIVQKVMHNHGGTVNARSAPSRGSTFTLTFIPDPVTRHPIGRG